MKPRQLFSNSGFTLIEVLVAATVLVVGTLAALGGLVAGAKLSLVAQRQDVMLHRARAELEQLVARGFGALSMNATASSTNSSSVSTNPDHYLYVYNTHYAYTPSYTDTTYTSGTFQWDTCLGTTGRSNCPPNDTPGSTSENTEPLVTTGSSGISYTPQTVTEGGNAGGNLLLTIYDFVTWAKDPPCAAASGAPAGCSSLGNDYKRVTVEVTQANGGAPRYPVTLSTLVGNPVAGEDPLNTPGATCGGPVCVDQLLDQPNTFFLHSDPSTDSTYTAPTASTTVHCTVTSGSPCPTGSATPDLVDTTYPTASSTSISYASDLDQAASTSTPGGRILQVNAATCSASSSQVLANNAKVEMWATHPLKNLDDTQSTFTLTGYGGITLYTNALGGVSAPDTLCAGIFDVAAVPLSAPPLIATACLTVNPFPALTGAVSFTLDKCGQSPGSGFGSHSITNGHRVGIALWLASAANAPAAQIFYDTKNNPAQVELNTQTQVSGG